MLRWSKSTTKVYIVVSLFKFYKRLDKQAGVTLYKLDKNRMSLRMQSFSMIELKKHRCTGVLVASLYKYKSSPIR